MTAIFKAILKGTFVVVILCLATNKVTTGNDIPNAADWTTCDARISLVCQCNREIFTDVIARCGFNHVTDLRMIISMPQSVLRINLTGNSIQHIPRNSFKRYTRLIYLSLSSNKIQTIGQGAFSGLARLHELNLQDNMIKQWDTTLIEQDLPNLIMLNVGQNIYWKPDQRILSLSNLNVIYLILDIKISRYYARPFRCYLLRNNTSHMYQWLTLNLSKDIENEVSPNTLLFNPRYCRYRKLGFRDVNYWDAINRSGFYFHCEIVLPKSKLHSEFLQYHPNSWYYVYMRIQPQCWSSIQKVHVFTLVVGICALVLNLIVIITTLRSRVLRESVAHVLVANIAVGDLMFSIYLTTVTITRQIMDADDYYAFYLPYYCKCVGFGLVIGPLLNQFMSITMTLERYLAVVYCMRPHIRITKRMAYVSIIIIWCLSISLAVSFMTSPQFARETDSMCAPSNNIDNIEVLHYVAGAGLLLYILSMALYVHMYRDFQKTNQKTVQLQRENRLARRIALIMFTNGFFLVFPLMMTPVLNNLEHVISESGRFIVQRSFAVTCLGINSAFNPLLFSFRNEKFRAEFRKCGLFPHNSVGNQS